MIRLGCVSLISVVCLWGARASAAQDGYLHAYGATDGQDLWSFALDANTKLPPTPPRKPVISLAAPEFQVDIAKAVAGERVYGRCGLSHGSGAVAGGIAADLRASPVPLSMEALSHVVRDGALQSRGMPR